MDDFEISIPYFQTRSANKKMKKRKQLDALLKFRPLTTKSSRNSNENLFTSEEELFLSPNKSKSNEISSIRSRRWWNYVRHIFSFCFVCIFMIVCVGLAYANIELKNEIQNLSLRVGEIEKRFSNVEIKEILSTIDQIKIRLQDIERWNVSQLNDRFYRLEKNLDQIQNEDRSKEISISNSNEDEDLLSKLKNIEQKSMKWIDVSEEFKKLNDDTQQRWNKNWLKEIRLLNETFFSYVFQWDEKFHLLKKQMEMFNQSEQFQQLTIRLTDLTNFILNSSNQSSTIFSDLRRKIDQLKFQIDTCPCSKLTTIDSSKAKQKNPVEDIVNQNSTTFV